MGWWVWAGFLGFFVVSLVVGVRLVALWWRTRELPELLIGIGVLGIGPIGFGSMMVGVTLVAQGTAEDALPVRLAMAAGFATVYVGVVSKCVFNWRVYRPASALARGAAIACGLALAALYVHAATIRGFTLAPSPHPAWFLQSGLQVAALLWGAGEAFHYWIMMRRRARIGLADPVVTNRFLLWSIGAASAGVGTGVGLVASFATGQTSFEIPWVVSSSSAHGFVAAVAMWLAFVPPSAYTDLVRRRAESTS